MQTERKEVIAAVALILNEILNLAEQFAIYFIAKDAALDEEGQQLFFFILFGVGGATLISPMFLWSKLKVVFDILIETGEFVAYLILLPRTTNLVVVASVFYGIEIVLLLIHLYATKSDLDDINSKTFIVAYCCFPARICSYGFLYIGSILFIFLDPSSQFRDTYYECLVIPSVFFGGISIDYTISRYMDPKDESDSIEETVYKVWESIKGVILAILGIVTFLTTLIFAGQGIRKHATGEQTLKSYDFGLYIYLLVSSGILAATLVCACCISIPLLLFKCVKSLS